MGFRLVPESVTLNDLERRSGCVVCVISPNSVAFGAPYVKVLSASEMYLIVVNKQWNFWIDRVIRIRSKKSCMSRVVDGNTDAQLFAAKYRDLYTSVSSV